MTSEKLSIMVVGFAAGVVVCIIICALFIVGTREEPPNTFYVDAHQKGQSIIQGCENTTKTIDECQESIVRIKQLLRSLTMPDYDARDRAIALQLMGWKPNNIQVCKKSQRGELVRCHGFVCELWAEDCGFNKAPPAYHSDPVAFDRLVKELENRGYEWHLNGTIVNNEKYVSFAEVHRYRCANTHKGEAPDYMKALVLATTIEGKFCPKCGNVINVPRTSKVGDAIDFCEYCKNSIEKYDTARVRPSL